MSNFIPFKNINRDYASSWDIPYQILLNTIEWREFRELIINRDNRKCQICDKEESEKLGNQFFSKPSEEEIKENSKKLPHDLGGDGLDVLQLSNVEIFGTPIDNPTVLHVHHKYYIFGNLPWEYQGEGLLTVCHNCHTKIHDNEKIPFYVDSNFKEKLNLTECVRCNGTGFLREYLHVQSGIRFRCQGRKYEEFIKQ